MSLLKKASIITTPTAYAEDYLYSIKPAQSLGAELITNGNFDTDSNWTTQTGWVISSGNATCDGTNGSYLYQTSTSLPPNTKVKVTVNIISYTSGTLRLGASAVVNSENSVSGIGFHSVIFTTISSGNSDVELFSQNFIGSIDNVSVKELTDADFDFDRNSTGTRVNEDYLIEDVPYNLVDKSEEQEDWSIYAFGGASIVRTPNQQSPFYDNKAVLFDFTAGTGSNGILVTRNATVGANMNNTLSVWMKGVVGGEIVKVACRNTASTGNDIGTVTITNQWKRYTFTIANNLSTTDRGFQFRFTSSDSVPTQSLFVYGAQIVKGDQPKDYLKTTDRLDIPRIDYTNGEPSILLEPSRTNLVTYSQDLSQWTLVNGTLTSNATVSPEGIQNAGKIVFSSVGLDLKRTITVVAGTTYTISFYIKVEEGTGLQGRFYDNSNSANIEYYNYDDQIIPNQWSRITRSVTAPSGCTEMQIWLLASSSTLVTASWWGAQFEAGSYETSLIHTSGSAVTCSADAANNAGNSDLINSTEGVLYAEIKALASDSTDKVITMSDGSTSNRVQVYFNSSNQIVGGLISSGSGQAAITYSTDIKLVSKIAFKFKQNDFALWVNGSEVGTDVVGNPATGLNVIDFDNGAGGANFFGKVKCVAVFKEALTDLELEKLTGYNNHELYMNYYNRLSYLGLVEEYNVESDINNYIL